jgi:hypothetical protein
VFDNFAGRNEIVFYSHTCKNGLGQVRSSLGRIMEEFAIERIKKDKDMYWAFRAMNESKSAKRQNRQSSIVGSG